MQKVTIKNLKKTHFTILILLIMVYSGDYQVTVRALAQQITGYVAIFC